MAEKRPLDSYMDVYPWPYTWNRDIAGSPIAALTVPRLVYEDLDFWTYENHFRVVESFAPVKDQWITDIYWSDDGEERLQLPPAVGDAVSAYLANNETENINVILWNHQAFYPEHGWIPWHGQQGDFVDHIHVEWKYPEN